MMAFANKDVSMTRALTKTAVQTLMKSAEEFCRENAQRFTDPRRHVLEIIARSEKPVGAYEVLEQLGAYVDDPKPPTAYRALEFWMEHGFIHRIESLNAYIACGTDHRHMGSQFLVCDGCGTVIEAHLCRLPEDLEKRVQKEGFKLSRWDAEVHGLCSACSR